MLWNVFSNSNQEKNLNSYSLRQLHFPQDLLAAQEGIEIVSGLSIVTTMAPAASRGVSGPKAILKFHHPSTLDYKARQGLQWTDC